MRKYCFISMAKQPRQGLKQGIALPVHQLVFKLKISHFPNHCCLTYYRSGTVNSNTVNSKFHLIRSFFEIFAIIISCLKCMVNSNTVNWKFHQFEVNLTGI